MANVKTMGGRRSRYWCGPGSVRANQNGARLSESGIGAPQMKKAETKPAADKRAINADRKL